MSSPPSSLADRVTAFMGTWAFQALHAVWFVVWLVLRLDINLLTMLVSLEAIFLSCFVLMSQAGQEKSLAQQREHTAEVLDQLEAQQRLTDDHMEVVNRKLDLLLERATIFPVDAEAPSR